MTVYNGFQYGGGGDGGYGGGSSGSGNGSGYNGGNAAPAATPQGFAFWTSVGGSPGSITLSANTLTDVQNGTPISFDFQSALTPSIGYTWGYSFRNSKTGHVSTMSPVSISSTVLALSGAHIYTLTGVGSNDPQVDTIELYRTEDGGATYFWVVDIPNAGGPWTFVDTIPDSQLNILIEAPIDYANNPPPTGFKDICKHLGRVWGSVGNYLYYSGGPDVTNGVGNESFPPANYFEFPGEIVCTVPTSAGLLVFLRDDLWIVTGVDSSSFYPSLLSSALGVSNHDAVAVDGQTVFVFTTTRQLHALRTNGEAQEIGDAIGDILQTFDPTQTNMAVLRASSLDVALYVSDGQSRILRYDLRTNIWSPVATPRQTVGTIAAIETSPGVVQLLCGQSTGDGSLYFRDSTTHLDDGQPFTASATIGVIQVAPQGSMAPLKAVSIQGSAAGSLPTVSVLPNEVPNKGVAFSPLSNPQPDPPRLAASKTIFSQRWYTATNTDEMPEQMQFCFLKIDWKAEDAANEIYNVAFKATA